MRPVAGLANARILLCFSVAVTATFVACGGTVAVLPTVTPGPWQSLMTPRPTRMLGPAGTGQDLFIGLAACSACHTIEGISQGVLGPPLDGIASAAGNRISGYSAEEYIRESIVEPDAYTAGTADGLSQDYQEGLMSATMAGIVLTDEDVDALVEYLLSLR